MALFPDELQNDSLTIMPHTLWFKKRPLITGLPTHSVGGQTNDSVVVAVVVCNWRLCDVICQRQHATAGQWCYVPLGRHLVHMTQVSTKLTDFYNILFTMY